MRGDWRGEEKEAQYPVTVGNAASFWSSWQERAQDSFRKLRSQTAADIPEQTLVNILKYLITEVIKNKSEK